MYPIILQIFIRLGALDSLSFSSSVLQSVLTDVFIGIFAVWIGITAVCITVVGMTVVGIPVTVGDGTTPAGTTVGITVVAADVIMVDVITDDVTAAWGLLKGFFIIGVDGAASIRISLEANKDSRPSYNSYQWLISMTHF